jgi:ribonuclease J
VVFIGRSVEQNVENALMLGKLKLDRHQIVNKRDIDQYSDDKLCLIVAGSQGQEGSTLVRAVFGEHQILRITQQDKVIFSADVIPGNEQTFYGAIDELSKNEIDVVYPDIVPGLHVSGHAGADEQRQMLEYGKAKYLFPIGGAYRHRKLFRDMAMASGYDRTHILLPGDGEVLQFQESNYSKGETIHLKELMVDGKGVGDVGTLVLSDRKVMSQDGMIVLVIPRMSGVLDLSRIEVISRGFIFMRDSEEFVFKIKQMTAEIITELQQAGEKEEEIRKKIDRRLTRRIDKMIGRTPLILPVFLNLDERGGTNKNKKRKSKNNSNRY